MSRRIAALAASAVLCAINPVMAQEPTKLEWAQTLNLPKGQNMPAGVKADMLGIELGAPYAEVMPLLRTLAAESPNRLAPSEQVKAFDLPVPTGKVRASYVAQATVVRLMDGSGKGSIPEELGVVFSAPSSGHQAVMIWRTINYPAPADQPKLADVINALKKKFKGTPILVRSIPDSQRHAFVFNNGVPAKAMACSQTQVSVHTTPEIAPSINPNRACDVVMWVEINLGFTPDHVKSIYFELSDNQRARLNLTADFEFLNAYVAGRVNKLREQTRSQPPKL